MNDSAECMLRESLSEVFTEANGKAEFFSYATCGAAAPNARSNIELKLKGEVSHRYPFVPQCSIRDLSLSPNPA